MGGGCAASLCQPVALAQALPGSAGVAVDGTNVYWASNVSDSIYRIKKDGSEATPTVLAKDAAGNVVTPWVLTIDDSYVYWASDRIRDDTNPGMVARCAKTGCNLVGTKLTPALDYPEGLAVDNSHIYFSESYMWTVGRADKADGGGFGYMVTEISNVTSVAVDDASVYFSGTDQLGDNTVGRIAKSAPVFTQDASVDAGVESYTHLSPVGVTAPYSLAIDDKSVYWTVFDDPGLIQSAPKTGVPDGGQPVTVAAQEHNPAQIATDDTNVYWVASGKNTAADPVNDYPIFVDGYVAMCPKTGCPGTGPIILTGSIHFVGFIAVDANAIYFTFQGNGPNEGGLMRLAKP
jgi:hypothetical protein